jgi:Inner membrane protein YgaP-like, transmembrane domain
MPFVDFMQSPLGRILRIVLGLALIGLGLFAFGGLPGVIVAIIGLVPLFAGAFGVCLVGPLFGTDFHGYIRTR